MRERPLVGLEAFRQKFSNWKSYPPNLKNYQAKLKDEVDQRISFEKESRDNKRLVKLQEEENENMILQIEELEMD